MENKRGVIEEYDPNMLFGFVKGRYGQSLFFHRSDFQSKEDPYIGEAVSYNTIFSSRGLQAINITK